MHGLPVVMLKTPATENNEEPKLGFYLTRLLYAMDVHYFPLYIDVFEHNKS